MSRMARTSGDAGHVAWTSTLTAAQAPATVRSNARLSWVPLVALAIVWLMSFVQLARLPLFDVDEGAFAEATIEMFQRHDFVSPFLNGLPRYDKPILVYWLQAASVRALGPSEFALRLPSLLCGIGWVLITGLFTRRAFGPRAGWLAAGILGLSLGVVTISGAATADALLNLLIAASMFAAWRYLDSGGRRWLDVVCVTAALGFLTKGPVAVAIPLIVTGAFSLARGRFAWWCRQAFAPRSVALFSAIALPWYGVMVHRQGWAFLAGFFGHHNAERFLSPLQGHDGNLLYYLPYTLAATLPFTGLLFPVLWRLRAIWNQDVECFLLLWFVTVLVLCSLSATKLPHYILYGATGLFVLMAVHADGLRSRAAALAGPFLLLAGLLVLPKVLTGLASRTEDIYLRVVLQSAAVHAPADYFLIISIGLVIVGWMVVDRRIGLRESMVASGAAAVVVVQALAGPMVAAAQQTPLKESAAIARQRHETIVTWGLNAPTFSFYYGRPVENREPRAGEIVVTTLRSWPELSRRSALPLYSKAGIILILMK